MVAKSIAKMYTNIHKPTDYYLPPGNVFGDGDDDNARTEPRRPGYATIDHLSDLLVNKPIQQLDKNKIMLNTNIFNSIPDRLTPFQVVHYTQQAKCSYVYNPNSNILVYFADYVGAYVRWNNTMSTGVNVSNGVRQGGILSPYLFCIYVDELSKMLNNVHVGCFVGTMLVNHLMYADDLVLLSPSAAGLSILLSICSTYGIEYDVMYNSTKSNVLIFRSKLLKNVHLPEFEINNTAIDRVSICINILVIASMMNCLMTMT